MLDGRQLCFCSLKNYESKSRFPKKEMKNLLSLDIEASDQNERLRYISSNVPITSVENKTT